MESTYSIPQKENKIRKGPWTPEEDTLLINYISFYGEGRWDALAKGSGLQRNGKSCRLRWVNYLRPGLKGTKLSKEEERLVLDLHQKWGNRWSRIARYLPGRTDNEIKNFFRSHYRRELNRSKEYNGNTESAICGFCRDESSICVEKMPYLGTKSNIVVNQYKESQVFGNSSSSPCHSLLESSLTCIDFYDDKEVSFLKVTSSSDSISEVFMDYTDQLWTIQEDYRVWSV